MPSDFPPLYSTSSLPQENALPLYTECPHTSEQRVLRSEPSSPLDVTLTQTRRCVYEADHFNVDLGQFPWALMYPAYGLNGVVEGTVIFKKKCTHVTQLSVKLEGTLAITASEYATVAVAGVSNTVLFSKTIQLVLEPDPKALHSVDAGSRYPFAISFPIYMKAQSVKLPPSYTAIHPGASADISYHIQVEVIRQGMLRRNEVRKIPVLYLPKSCPSTDSLIEFPRASIVNLPDRVHGSSLSPIWPDTCEAKSLSSIELPVIHVFLPTPRCYASGEPVPLAICISCSSSPALAKLYTTDITIQLVKRRKLWVAGGRQLNIRETMVSTAIPNGRVECSNGEAYLTYRLEAGKRGRESSFGVEGLLEVMFVVRVIVKPPQDVRHLPIFRHDELIQLTTDPHDTFETEILAGNGSEPALGLTTLRPAITPRSSSQAA